MHALDDHAANDQRAVGQINVDNIDEMPLANDVVEAAATGENSVGNIDGQIDEIPMANDVVEMAGSGENGATNIQHPVAIEQQDENEEETKNDSIIFMGAYVTGKLVCFIRDLSEPIFIGVFFTDENIAVKKEESVEKKEPSSPAPQLSLLSDRIASINLRDATTESAAGRLNNNAIGQFNFGSNAIFPMNPRIGSRFNDAFSPASHRASNPLQFGSVSFFSPVAFGCGHTARFGAVSNPFCSNGPEHANNTKINWTPIVKSGMYFFVSN